MPSPALRALCALVLVATACRRSPPAEAPRLVEIRVVEPGGEGGSGARVWPVDAAAIAARATERARAANVLPVVVESTPRDGIDYRLTLTVRVIEERREGEGALRAFVSAKLARAGSTFERPIAASAIAERRVTADRPVDEAAARAHAERAAGDIVDGLMRLAAIHTGGAPAVLAALADKDPDVRAEAIRAAALRREAAAVPALIALLRDGDPATRDAALGALTEIGDRRAVKPITEIAKLRDTEALPKVIDAMGTLGGDEARAYLEFVQSGHDDAGTRELARAALARMARREAARP